VVDLRGHAGPATGSSVPSVLRAKRGEAGANLTRSTEVTEGAAAATGAATFEGSPGWSWPGGPGVATM